MLYYYQAMSFYNLQQKGHYFREVTANENKNEKSIKKVKVTLSKSLPLSSVEDIEEVIWINPGLCTGFLVRG
jgi:hypothetical protein